MQAHRTIFINVVGEIAMFLLIERASQMLIRVLHTQVFMSGTDPTTNPAVIGNILWVN